MMPDTQFFPRRIGLIDMGKLNDLLNRAGYANPGTVTPATVSSITTAGAVTYTPAQILGGIIVRDPNGAARTDTLPTAALLVAAVPQAFVGLTIRCTITNAADAAETITIAAGTGGAFDAAQIAATRII